MAKKLARCVIVWEFHVKIATRRRFETIYGPRGCWARFFAKGKGHLGTDLFRDAKKKGRYLTIDRWVLRAAYESFRARHREEYATIDRECEALTKEEFALGIFVNIGRTNSAGRRKSRSPKGFLVQTTTASTDKTGGRKSARTFHRAPSSRE